jgi:inner membrane protein
MATLLIGANAPDIDVFSHFAGSLAALDFRRGWTHGLLAVIVLPFILAACIMLWDRLSRLLQRSASPVRPREILLLSLIAIATHPLLDFCNTYGMRWLMPFVDRWQYADTLFIVDPWMWAATPTVCGGSCRSSIAGSMPTRCSLLIRGCGQRSSSGSLSREG